MPSEIKPGVYWVGAVDWGLRHFHGFELSTHRGSSYNAYLIMDEKVAVVDTVWSPFTDEFMKNVREIIDPSRIDYVVVNHSEMDHSGALPELLRAAPQAEVLVSKRGLDSVPGHFHEGWTLRAVQNGETLSLGAHELVFVDAPMLHWPDSMFTYVTGHNLLLPNDAFGQHYATAFRFNDQVDSDELYYEALKYYANILTPYSDRVLKKIDELLALGLPVDMIAPSHGVIWRQDPLQIVTRYQEWARQAPARRAVVIYDTMWEATRRMAEAISKGLSAEGVPHRLCHIPVTDENDILAEVFQSGAVLFGSPTLNRGMLPSLAPLLEQMHGLGFKNKVGAAFGSYGWGGEAVRRIEEQLERANVTLVAKGVRAKWQPTESDLAACEALGREVATALPPLTAERLQSRTTQAAPSNRAPLCISYRHARALTHSSDLHRIGPHRYEAGGPMVIDAHSHVPGCGIAIGSTVADLIDAMDRLAIDVACVSLPMLNPAPPPESVCEANDAVLAALRAHPDRLLGYCYVNPGYLDAAMQELRRCVVGEGMIGIKLYLQYRADDPVVYPIIEQAIAWSVPILWHVNNTPELWRNRDPSAQGALSHSGHVAALARRYPEAMLIEGHIGGGGDWEWAIKTLRPVPNVWLDTSGSVIDEGMVDMAVRELGAERVLFGTDLSMEAGVGKLRAARLTDDERRRILGDNMRAILSLRAVPTRGAS